MIKFSTEKLREILAGAPKNDNHFLELDGNHTRYTRLASSHHNLSDLREILELRERVEDLENQQQWISVEDRIPNEDDGAVLFWFDGGAYTGWPVNSGEHWETDEFGVDIFGVTHWMPLPQPPKGGHQSAIQQAKIDAVRELAEDLGLYLPEYDDQEYIEIPRGKVKEFIEKLKEQGE